MRSRITITISEDLLKQVDTTIDNRTVRNRSQAIESLLRQTLTPSVSTAVILAGGSLTSDPQTGKDIPKSLISINNRPVIVHLLEHLRKANFTKVVICTSPNSSEEIKLALKKEGDLGIPIVYSNEPEKLGTGGAIKYASEHIPDNPFLVIHGDVLTDIDLLELVSFFNTSKTLAVLAIKPRPGRLSYGRVFLEGSNVIDFQVPDKASAISLVNTGIYIFDHSVFDIFPDKKYFKIEEEVIPELVKRNQVAGSVFQGIWFDVSEVESYQEANDRWQA